MYWSWARREGEALEGEESALGRLLGGGLCATWRRGGGDEERCIGRGGRKSQLPKKGKSLRKVYATKVTFGLEKKEMR